MQCSSGVCTGEVKLLLPPWQNEVMVFGSVGLFVCLSVCEQHYWKLWEWIGMKFYGGVLGSTMKNWLNFGGDVGLLRLNEPQTP